MLALIIIIIVLVVVVVLLSALRSLCDDDDAVRFRTLTTSVCRVCLHNRIRWSEETSTDDAPQPPWNGNFSFVHIQ